MTGRKTKVAVIATHPIQYFTPLYAFLNDTPDIEVTALYLSDFSLRGANDPGFQQPVAWDIDLLSGYRRQFVGPRWREIEPFGLKRSFVPQMFEAVRRGGYDALWLDGHVTAANFFGLAAARLVGAKVLMRSETHLGLTRKPLKAALRKPLLSALYSQCDHFLAIGSANRDFYRAMGAPAQKITLFPYAVDNARFMRTSQLDPQQRADIRRRLGLSPDRPAVLFVSKLQRRKHPDDLLRAAHRLTDEGLQFDLVLAGSGEMRDELGTLATQGPAHVVFPGFVNQQDMPKLLGACDIFVLPSTDEPWGLIVNEAMCAGLPIVLSEEIGCRRDLLRHGENGFAFPARDIERLADALRPLIGDAAMRAAMAQKSREIIDGWDYRRCLDGLRAALAATSRRESA